MTKPAQPGSPFRDTLEPDFFIRPGMVPQMSPVNRAVVATGASFSISSTARASSRKPVPQPSRMGIKS